MYIFNIERKEGDETHRLVSTVANSSKSIFNINRASIWRCDDSAELLI